jgi:hypothetical protein
MEDVTAGGTNADQIVGMFAQLLGQVANAFNKSQWTFMTFTDAPTVHVNKSAVWTDNDGFD